MYKLTLTIRGLPKLNVWIMPGYIKYPVGDKTLVDMRIELLLEAQEVSVSDLNITTVSRQLLYSFGEINVINAMTNRSNWSHDKRL